jgi:hypothetical protein
VRAIKKGEESPNEQKNPGQFSLVGVLSVPIGAFIKFRKAPAGKNARVQTPNHRSGNASSKPSVSMLARPTCAAAIMRGTRMIRSMNSGIHSLSGAMLLPRRRLDQNGQVGRQKEGADTWDYVTTPQAAFYELKGPTYGEVVHFGKAGPAKSPFVTWEWSALLPATAQQGSGTIQIRINSNGSLLAGSLLVAWNIEFQTHPDYPNSINEGKASITIENLWPHSAEKIDKVNSVPLFNCANAAWSRFKRVFAGSPYPRCRPRQAARAGREGAFRG